LIFIALFVLSAFGNKKPAYLIYPSGKGKDVAFGMFGGSNKREDIKFPPGKLLEIDL